MKEETIEQKVEGIRWKYEKGIINCRQFVAQLMEIINAYKEERET